MHRFFTLADIRCRVDRVRTFEHYDQLFSQPDEAAHGFAVVDVTLQNPLARSRRLPTYLISFSTVDGERFGGRYELDDLGPYVGNYPTATLNDASFAELGPGRTLHAFFIVLNWPRVPLARLFFDVTIGVDLARTQVDLTIPNWTPDLLRIGQNTRLADVDVRLDEVRSVAKRDGNPVFRHRTNQDPYAGYFLIKATMHNPSRTERRAVPHLFPAFQIMENGDTNRHNVFGPFTGANFVAATTDLKPDETLTVSYLVTDWLYQEDIIGMTLDAEMSIPLLGS
ncbi:MAG: hypothetical protein M3Z37_08215 [Candidatus Eremiobacteraeota bacterium]|nr:hypothetical protein [Candidatus Eremiobacteraeota bacterium]